MRKAIPVAIALGWALLACATDAPRTLESLSDAPDPQHVRSQATDLPASYSAALRTWQTAEGINSWIAARFVYDRTRALSMSESARAVARVPVHQPEEFFARPVGICVDLAHFAVASLRRIEPGAQASYLMIEFEPVQISGQTLRRHWLAAYQKDGKFYFFADSKRPGYMAGPYASADQFIAEYAVYRQRPIVAHRLLDTYERRERRRAPKTLRDEPA